MKFLVVTCTSTRPLTRKSFTRKHVERCANCLNLFPLLEAELTMVYMLMWLDFVLTDTLNFFLF